MGWLFDYADLVSALLGLAGAGVLAWPGVRSVIAKRRWEIQTDLEHRHVGDAASAEALRGIRDHVEAAQLGDPVGAFSSNLLGFLLLAGSFFFLAVAAVERHNERHPTLSSGPCSGSTDSSVSSAHKLCQPNVPLQLNSNTAARRRVCHALEGPEFDRIPRVLPWQRGVVS